MNKKELYDEKIFKKALKIIMSKRQKPKEEFFSSSMIRYNDSTSKLDVIGCAHVINELKIYFDGSNVKQKSVKAQLLEIEIDLLELHDKYSRKVISLNSYLAETKRLEEKANKIN